MISSIYLKNFRNFSQKEISLLPGKNIIIWKNGHGKSNILEALSLPASPLVESKSEYLIKRKSDVLHISYVLSYGNQAFSYSLKEKRKKYLIEGTSTTKNKFTANYPLVVSFHPLIMNMMYLGPNERRSFLDSTLSQSFPLYASILQKYKKILSSRNKLLKNISEWKSDISELRFWNNEFIESSTQIYSYRKIFVEFISENIKELEKYFLIDNTHIHFSYITKTDIFDPENDIKSYIEKNTQKEILLRKTLRGPHLDDFDIFVENTPLVHYASRGEVKSSILWLKFLESHFIQKHNAQRPLLFLIDDLLSELDSEHRDIIWAHIWERQSVISSIEDFDVEWNKIYI